MNRHWRKYWWIPASILLFAFVSIYVVNLKNTQSQSLPVFHPADINPDLVDPHVDKTKAVHTIGDFHLTDQEGNPVTPEIFKNKIYVADFFFVTCPTICPKMTKNMKILQDRFKNDDRVLFISHTVMPEHDSVPVLKQYAIENGIIYGKWYLVTGDKKHIYDLARKHYFAAVSKGDGGPNDFIHTENFVLIDPDKRIRGFYDGTSAEEIDRLTNDIRTLLKEYEIQHLQ